MIIRMQGNTHLQTDSPQWTTALVCSEVPDAILVSAQAASNCNGGLKQQHKVHSPDVYIKYYLNI